MKQCSVKPNNNQSQRPPLPQQKQAFQQRIYATLDSWQAEQQIGPIETPSKIYENPVSILIDTGASECFISLKLLSRFPKRSSFMAKPQTVEYANQSKAKVEQCLFEAQVDFPNFSTELNLYIVPLGSYDIIIGIN